MVLSALAPPSKQCQMAMKHMDAYGNVGFVLVLVMTLHVSMKDRKHMDEVLLML